MEDEKEYADFLPKGFDTWTSFYNALVADGQQDDEIVHYVEEAEIGGVPVIAPFDVIPPAETYYKMELIKDKVAEEKAGRSKK